MFSLALAQLRSQRSPQINKLLANALDLRLNLTLTPSNPKKHTIAPGDGDPGTMMPPLGASGHAGSGLALAWRLRVFSF
jgi:hypothetical protein